MNLDNIKLLLEWTYLNPHWAIAITFLLAFVETFAIIGILIPGAVILTILGTIIGMGFLPGFIITLAAIAGTIAGDTASFLLGYYYHQKIRRMWPLNKYSSWLTKGERFFQHYGSKSVFFARFVGPVRPVVPLLAGMLKMHPAKFLLANVSSAVIWVPAFLLPGILIGVASVELAPGATFKLLVYLGLTLLGMWLTIQLFKLFFWRFYKIAYRILNFMWHRLLSHPKLRKLCELMKDPEHPYGPGQLALLLIALLFFIFFVIVLISVNQQGFITSLNTFILYLLRDFHSETLEHIAVGITLLGDKYLIGIFTALLITILLSMKHKRAAFYTTLVMGSAYFSTWVLKYLVASARPLGTIAGMGMDSFPSGHTMLATTFFLFLAIIIARHSPIHKRIPTYLLATGIIALILLTRLYLGVHWWSDILGSLLLAITIVLLITIPYRHLKAREMKVTSFITILSIALISAWGIFAMYTYSKQVDYYQHNPVLSATETTTWLNSQDKIPTLYASGRLDYANQSINLQWAASLDQIKQLLEQRGWMHYKPGINLQTLAQHLSTESSYQTTFFPLLYRGELPVLIATRYNDANNRQLVVTLWDMHLYLSDRDTPVWAASVNYQQSKAMSTITSNHTALLKEKNAALSILKEDLINMKLQDYLNNELLILYAWN